jgi:hypothetical protein
MSIAHLSVQINFIVKTTIIIILIACIGQRGFFFFRFTATLHFLFLLSKGSNASRNATQNALFTRDFFFFLITHRDHDDGIIMMDRASNGHFKGENKYILPNQLHLPEHSFALHTTVDLLEETPMSHGTSRLK